MVSENNPSEKLTGIPFSREVITSYYNLMTNIFLVLSTVIHYHLIMMQRDIQGVVPNPESYFNHFLKDDKKSLMKEIWEEFEKNFTSEDKQFHAQVKPLAEYTPWYIHLDLYKKLNTDIIKEKEFLNNQRS